MSGLVIELQRSASDPHVAVSSLLRKALVAAAKLRLKELEEWIKYELNGYNGSPLPGYREVHGEPEGYDRFTGMLPIVCEDPRIAETISKGFIAHSVPELEHIVTAGGDRLEMAYPPTIANQIRKMLGHDVVPKLIISKAALHGILGAIRSRILEWSLQLERDGILGEGMSFSDTEKQIAASTVLNIKHFLNVGHMEGSQIQQGSPNARQLMRPAQSQLQPIADFLIELRSKLPSLDLTQLDVEKVEASAATIDAQISSPEPHPVILRESLKTIRTVVENAAGGVLAAELLRQLPHLLMLLGAGS